jgi:adenine C2-methylase RlmN of 23S rRNA A2503 and tRNA A37
MNYKFVKAFEFNYNFGTLLSVDFGSYNEGSDLINLTEEIFYEIRDCIHNRGVPSLIWFKGISDSINHTNFKLITKMIKTVYPNQKIGVYLNCGIFQDIEARDIFNGCDLVAINLNTVDDFHFSKINKCHESIKPKDLLEGIVKFSKKFKGKIGIYTMFLKGINDNVRTVQKLKDFLLTVKPDHFSVSNYTLDGFEPVSEDFKEDLKKRLDDLPFKVIYMF